MICLIRYQSKCQSAGAGLEPAGGNSAIHGNTGGCQGRRRTQSEICRIGSQNDVPVTATEVIGIDAGNTDAGLYTAVSLGEEHIVFFQGEATQYHTGRKDYLMVCLVSCQSKCQSAGAGLEPAGGDGPVNCYAGICQRGRSTQGEIGIIGLQNNVPVTATEVICVDTGDGKFVGCGRCSKNRYHRENQAKGQKERKYAFHLFHCSNPPFLYCALTRLSLSLP